METKSQSGIIVKVSLSLGERTDSAFRLEVDLRLPGNGITGILGHSGSGKTTLLRCIAGLEHRQTGSVIVNGETWQDDSTFLPVHKRPLGYVFQEPSLFPHLNAQQNIAFGAKRAAQKPNEAQYQQILDMLGIAPILLKYPDQLSGGEQQRVAIARALMVDPQILLMDEPLSSLDDARKQEVLPYLEQLRDQLKIPMIYVTHSVNEVTRLAQQAVLLQYGKVVSSGSLNTVFGHQGNGTMNNLAAVIDAQVIGKDEHWQLTHCRFAGGELWLCDTSTSLTQQVRIRISASDVSISLDEWPNSSILNRFACRIEAMKSEPSSPMTLIKLQVGQQQILAQLTRKSVHDLGLENGMQVWAQIKSAAIVR